MCDIEKVDETLSSKNEFYSLSSDKGISDKQYQYVLKVQNKFEKDTIKDYHNFYLKCNVLLFADTFDKFRNTCLENYDLFFKLDLISEVAMYLSFEKGMTGCAFYIPKTYSRANKSLTSYDLKNQHNILHNLTKIIYTVMLS